MSARQLSELENVMQLLIDEHRRLLAHLESQQNAMKKLQLDAMEDAMHRQESSRLRIAGLEGKRRFLSQQFAKLSRSNGEMTLAQIAAAHPQAGPKLLGQRDELKKLIKQISDRTHVAGRLASAVLGHLNTAMRLFAGAVGQSGTYTKHGTPKVAARIGVMEAVG
jgi:hypothetical protein